MTPDFTIKVGDTLPALTAILKLNNVVIPDLANATNVKLCLVKRNDPNKTYVFAANASILDAAAGKVTYNWTSSDTTTIGAGIYNAEWHISYTGGGKRTVPTAGNFIVEIEARNPEAAP